MSSHKSHVQKRREKFYQLAKQQGYRSRAAFKLIQLNKKFNFLANSKACLDLCAAPGGWLQVAAKYMPVSSLLIGIDLLPIRPLPNVITLVEDITTQSCRAAIKKKLQSWQVDLVLHDGAPNVGGGGTWAKDAFVQVELVLHSLKLASEFLCEGGTFVTKIFRSADYMALIWVLKQFFRRVDVTRPVASRQVSAEIFAVCQGYLAPKKIDPKLFDPTVVFRPTTVASDQAAAKSATGLFGQSHQKRPNRSGYSSDKLALHEVLPVSEFINAENPTTVLARANVLEWDPEAEVYRKHRATTPEISELFKDIKVLGTSDFGQLIRWHKKMHRFKNELQYEIAMAEAAEAAARAAAAGASAADALVEQTAEEIAANEKAAKDLELNALFEKLDTRKKREKKKRHEEKMKEIRRLALNVNSQKDSDANADDGVFRMRAMGSDDVAKALRAHGRAVDDTDGEKLGGMDAAKFREIITTNQLLDEAQVSSGAEEDEDEDEEEEEDISDTERRVREQERSVSYLYDEYKKRRNIVDKKKDKRVLGLDSDEFATALVGGGSAAGAGTSKNGPVKLDSDDDGEAGEDSSEDDAARPRSDALQRARDHVAQGRNKLSQLSEGASETAAVRAERWFSQGAFADVDLGLSGDDNDDDDDDSDEERAAALARARAALSAHTAKLAKDKSLGAKGAAALAAAAGAAATSRTKRPATATASSVSDDEDEEEDGGFEVAPATAASNGAGAAPMSRRRAAQMAPSDSDDTDTTDDEDTREARSRWLGSAEEQVKQDAKRAKALMAAQAARGKANSEAFGDAPLSDYSDDSDARAEILAMGTKMLRKKERNAMVDAAYNKYSYNDHDGLPDWFVDEENQHNKAQLPITKAEVEAVKQQQIGRASCRERV